jgi:hypothetical protein
MKYLDRRPPPPKTSSPQGTAQRTHRAHIVGTAAPEMSPPVRRPVAVKTKAERKAVLTHRLKKKKKMR